jgi:hypothetical protein
MSPVEQAIEVLRDTLHEQCRYMDHDQYRAVVEGFLAQLGRQSEPPVALPLWEYHRSDVDGPVELDRLGNLGWELIAVADHTKFFKRPAPGRRT